MSVDRQKTSIFISISSAYKELSPSEVYSLFLLNYGELQAKTNLTLASGLEGFLAKLISEKIEVPLRTEISQSGVIFILEVKAQSF